MMYTANIEPSDAHGGQVVLAVAIDAMIGAHFKLLALIKVLLSV